MERIFPFLNKHRRKSSAIWSFDVRVITNKFLFSFDFEWHFDLFDVQFGNILIFRVFTKTFSKKKNSWKFKNGLMQLLIGRRTVSHRATCSTLYGNYAMIIFSFWRQIYRHHNINVKFSSLNSNFHHKFKFQGQVRQQRKSASAACGQKSRHLDFRQRSLALASQRRQQRTWRKFYEKGRDKSNWRDVWTWRGGEGGCGRDPAQMSYRNLQFWTLHEGDKKVKIIS